MIHALTWRRDGHEMVFVRVGRSDKFRPAEPGFRGVAIVYDTPAGARAAIQGAKVAYLSAPRTKHVDALNEAADWWQRNTERIVA